MVYGLCGEEVAVAAKRDAGALFRDKLLASSSASAYACADGARDAIRDNDEELNDEEDLPSLGSAAGHMALASLDACLGTSFPTPATSAGILASGVGALASASPNGKYQMQTLDDIEVEFRPRVRGEKKRRELAEAGLSAHKRPMKVSAKLLAAFFRMPLVRAAEKLGMSKTGLMSMCRKLGIQRWPYWAARGPAPGSQGRHTHTKDASTQTDSSVAGVHECDVPALVDADAAFDEREDDVHAWWH